MIIIWSRFIRGVISLEVLVHRIIRQLESCNLQVACTKAKTCWIGLITSGEVGKDLDERHNVNLKVKVFLAFTVCYQFAPYRLVFQVASDICTLCDRSFNSFSVNRL